MMDYSLILPLEHMAAVKLVVTLWNRVDVNILTSLSDESDQKWKELENRVEGKLENLPLPEKLIEKLSDFISPIGIRILRWVMSYKRILLNYSQLSIKYLISIICLTSKGTIDEGKTAKVLVKDKYLEINLRFRLACIYCIEDYIYTLWEKIDDKKFYKKNLWLISRHEPCLISFWVHYIQGKVVKLDCIEAGTCPYEYGFECAIGQHDIYGNNNKFLYDTTPNEVAAKYFSQKLSFEEKQRELVKYVKMVVNYRCRSNNKRNVGNYADILCFLLSIMNEEQQEEIFKKYNYEMLVCLLCWPWQIFFAETVERILNLEDDHFSEINYENILMKIIDKTIHGYSDYNYQELLGNLWQQSPLRYKRFVLYRLPEGSLLLKLFKARDKQNIELILEDATVSERENIIFTSGINLCRCLVYEERYDLLKLFIEKCISSKDLMIKFKNEFIELNKNNSEKQLEKREKWDKFFHLLDELIRRFNKRKNIEKDADHPTEKFFNIELK